MVLRPVATRAGLVASVRVAAADPTGRPDRRLARVAPRVPFVDVDGFVGDARVRVDWFDVDVHVGAHVWRESPVDTIVQHRVVAEPHARRVLEAFAATVRRAAGAGVYGHCMRQGTPQGTEVGGCATQLSNLR